MRLKADLTLLAVAAIWGTAFVSQSIAAQYQLAYLFNGASFLLASLIMLPFIPRKRKISRGQWFWMCAAGGILFIASALQQVGIFTTKVANAGFLTSLYTVFTPFILFLLFREKPVWLDVIAVAAASLGAFFLSTAGSYQIQPGDGLELVGAIFWALHMVVLGKYASRFEPISFAAGQFFAGGLLNLVLGLFTEHLGTLTAPPVLGAILYRTVFSIGIGYTLQVWGQRHTPPTDAALILSMEGVFAALAAWFLLQQHLQPIQIVGCLIIFGAVLLSQFKEMHPTAAPQN